MGSKARYVPRFLTAYLKHIVHQDWVNGFLVSAADLKGSAWLKACLDYQDIRIRVRGMDNLPPADDGKLYTFVSNHPLGGIDGVAVGAVIGSHYNDHNVSNSSPASSHCAECLMPWSVEENTCLQLAINRY